MADQYLSPTPYANQFTGYSNDLIQGLLGYMKDKQRTQQMQGFAGLLESTGIPQSVERAAYAQSPKALLDALTNVNRANVPLLKAETADALMTVAPMVGPALRGAGAAARGVGRVAGNAVNEAMVYGRGPLASITPQPMRAVELGPEFLGKRPPKIENLARTSDKFLFHSSTADKANDLRYGVEPQAGGPWVREVAAGATDQNLDDFFENVTPLAWFSDKPEWIKSMVGRKLNKPFDKVTAKDIEEHGHLAFINKKSPEAENITYIPEQGLMEGGQSKVFDIQGNPKKAWETGLYQEGRYGTQMEPFGVERNEYVSPESIEPLLQLTGPELVQFMKLKGLLDQPSKAASAFDVSRRDASDIFGAGAERVMYKDPKSGGTMEVLAKPDGTASVLSLEVPETSRGKGIGQSLQAQVMQDFPEMMGQVSSKAAGKTAYRLGRRPPNEPNATLDDVYKIMDENSSVNLVSPEMQKRFMPEGGLLGQSKAASVSSLSDIENKFKDIALDVYEKNGTINLSRIVIPKEMRSSGIGSSAMSDLTSYADQTGQKMALTPSSDFGGNVKRLKDFYKQFGFVENKGKNKDFSTMETMIRLPEISKEPKEITNLLD